MLYFVFNSHKLFAEPSFCLAVLIIIRPNQHQWNYYSHRTYVKTQRCTNSMHFLLTKQIKHTEQQ